MATAKVQRIGIIIITLILVAGTMFGFLAIILSQKNATSDKASLETQYAAYQAAYTDYEAAVTAQTTELSNKYFNAFSQYVSRVAEFDSETVKKLKVEDLLVGSGEEITSNTKYNSYYIGWNPSGKVFDQSISGETLLAPLSSDTSFIEGWVEGLTGMRIGGVRELTIPSNLAYGSKGKGDDIPADTPLKFIIMVIPPVEAITAPELSDYITNF
jgi:FKBP-type peptidyl-prolyl cis-trans isomerase FkpA